MTTSKRRTRGSTLVEVMVASVILLVGMTGVVAMLLKGMSASREAAVKREAQNLSVSVAAQYATVPYVGLWGDGGGGFGSSYTIDGGILLDPDGRKYPSAVVITNISDGGIGAVQVTVHTQWTNFMRQPVDAVATTMVSDFPDAG